MIEKFENKQKYLYEEEFNGQPLKWGCLILWTSKHILYFKVTGTTTRQIGRWYNLDVVIKGASGDKYYGEISKFKQLGEVLHLLEQGIVFELDKATPTIVVKP